MNQNHDNQNTEINEEDYVKKLNNWLIALIVFIILYSAAMLAIIDQKTEKALQTHPIVMIDPVTLQVSAAYTNLIQSSFLTQRIDLATGNNSSTNNSKPMFEQKENYEIGDFVVVKDFYVEGIILEKITKDQYKFMYKDHNHVLQEIILPRQFLLAPTTYNIISPVSLLSD